ncbi:hypothetical protein AC249_AIPGENE13110 [Exaiptasia diaphana]|nr:hypothetical protein AC249_AIPGENE13110 [Exaiptasia diaphana]
MEPNIHDDADDGENSTEVCAMKEQLYKNLNFGKFGTVRSVGRTQTVQEYLTNFFTLILELPINISYSNTKKML